MSDLTPESCAAKTKQWWIDFYKSPCFGIKCISATIILGLAAFGLFKIITSAFYYFSEPLSYFDPERLGQLGDFLGGTLNPIFGFATVCLLLWSVFIQRNELQETKRELKSSSSALRGQLELAKNEYSRKQLEERLSSLEKDYQDIFTYKFEDIYVTERSMDAGQNYDKFYNLLVFHYIVNNDMDRSVIDEIKSAIRNFKKAHKENNLEKAISESTKFHVTCWRMRNVVTKHTQISLEFLSTTASKSIAYMLAEEIKQKLRQCNKIGILSDRYVHHVETEIHKTINKISTLND